MLTKLANHIAKSADCKLGSYPFLHVRVDGYDRSLVETPLTKNFSLVIYKNISDTAKSTAF